MNGYYTVRPRARADLRDLALYYSTEASPEIGRRFLAAAHDTFALLASQPHIGWHSGSRRIPLHELRFFRVKVSKKFSSSTFRWTAA